MRKKTLCLIVALCFSLQFNSLAEEKKAAIAVGPTYFRVQAASNGDAELKSFRDMLTTSLSHSDKFDVVERDRLGDVFGEQNLDQSKGFDQVTTAELGKLKGVDYLFLGSITQLALTPKVNTTSNAGTVATVGAASAIGGAALSLFGGRASSASSIFNAAPRPQVTYSQTIQYVANITVDMKIIDVVTGKIIIADAVQAYAVGPISQGASNPTDANMLVDSAMRNIAQDIVKRISVAVYPIKVANVHDDVAILNYGDSVLAQGDLIDVFSEGEKILDPDTGAVLTNSEEKIGLIRVDSVERKFSKGKILAGKDKILAGSLCRINPDAKMPKATLQVQS